MYRAIEPLQLAEEINSMIQTENDIYLTFANYQYAVEYLLVIDGMQIKAYFHWSEELQPQIIRYGSQEWVELTQQIPAFQMLSQLNQKAMKYQCVDEYDIANKILELQIQIADLGFTTCSHVVKENDQLYYTIRREEEHK